MLSSERDIVEAPGESLDWFYGSALARYRYEEKLVAKALIALCNEVLDGDFYRLAHFTKALILKSVASELSDDLPDKPGVSSAYAISTIIAEGWVRSGDGTFRPHDRAHDLGHLPDPVDAGKSWRKRLLRKMRDREKRMPIVQLDELMSFILNDFVPAKLHRATPDLHIAPL